MSLPSCAACGSNRLRRARMRSDWQRLLKRLTPLRRYACGECHHCGWTLGRLPHSEHPEEVQLRPAAAPGAALARRRRTRSRRWPRLATQVLVALALGAGIALVIGLIGTIGPSGRR